MSRWLVKAAEMVSDSIEIDKPTDEKEIEHLDRLFKILKNIQKDDSWYIVDVKDEDSKYILTITQGHTSKEDETTMSYVKELLKRYNINYREISNV